MSNTVLAQYSTVQYSSTVLIVILNSTGAHPSVVLNSTVLYCTILNFLYQLLYFVMYGTTLIRLLVWVLCCTV